MHGCVTAPGALDRPLPLLRIGSWYESLDRSPAPAAGLPALSLAPEILIRVDARTLRAKADQAPGPAERIAVLARALEIFSFGKVSCGDLGTQSADDFRAALWAWAGLPPALVDHWCELLRTGLSRLHSVEREEGEREEGDRAGPDRLPLTLVSLPGNTFTCLESVCGALASGSAVWVRPSTAEPLSALRLVAALIDAGWPAGQLGFYPTAHAVLPALVAVTDRQIVYGGDGVCAALRAVPTATLHGPMRVCALVPKGADPAVAASRLLPLIAGEAGRFCTTLRAIFCLGNPADLAERLARLLDEIPFSPADLGLPLAACVRPEQAMATHAAITSRLGPADEIVTRRPVVSHDGLLTYLAPTLIRLDPLPHSDSKGPTMSPGRQQGPHDALEGPPLVWGNPPLLGFEAPFPLATIIGVTAGQAVALTQTADTVHQLPTASEEGCRT